jgi:DNA mismatch repair protein MutS2
LLRKSTQFAIGLAKDQDRSLDLRGESVDEALLSLERELDIAMQRGEDRMRVIHGHGTEALKRAVRAYLSRSLYVKKWKAGTPETGGDGLTWVEIGKD